MKLLSFLHSYHLPSSLLLPPPPPSSVLYIFVRHDVVRRGCCGWGRGRALAALVPNGGGREEAGGRWVVDFGPIS